MTNGPSLAPAALPVATPITGPPSPPLHVAAPSGKARQRVWFVGGAVLALVGLVVILVVLLWPRGKQEARHDSGEAAGLSVSKAEALVRHYLEAKRWQDRLAFVADADQVAPLMKAKYTDQAPPAFTAITTRPPEHRTDGGDWDLVGATWSDNDGNPQRGDFVLRATPKGPKIDWPASAGYNPQTLRAFAAERPGTAREFRVVCELTDYYNFAFGTAQQTHYSVRLLEGNPYQQMNGYVLKSSPDGRRIFNLLKGGKPNNLILELQLIGPDGYPLDGKDGGGICTITRLIRTSWVDDL